MTLKPQSAMNIYVCPGVNELTLGVLQDFMSFVGHFEGRHLACKGNSKTLIAKETCTKHCNFIFSFVSRDGLASLGIVTAHFRSQIYETGEIRVNSICYVWLADCLT